MPDEPAIPTAGAPVKRGLFGRAKKPKKKYGSMLGYLWGEWVRPLGTIFIVLGLFRLIAFDWFDVPTGSMEPTIMIGDRIAVHKWTYGLRVPFTKDTWIAKWDRPERGDIVVCYSPDRGDEVRLVKRIVAGPGDRIQMVDGRLIINGEPATYAEPQPGIADFIDPVEASKFDFYTEQTPGDAHAVMFQRDARSIRSFPEITVPEGQYAMIGDNRDNSKDSRAWNLSQQQWGASLGFIGHERIHGRAFAVAFSLDKRNFYLPRLGRFFKALD
jgi:signal peptidase I